MAAPSYASDVTSGVIYEDTDNFSTVGGGRVTASETDDYIQGSNCWSHDPFSSGIEGGMYDDGTAPTIASGDVVFIWTKCDVAATLATHAAGGIQILMGNSTTAYYAWYVLGSDDYQYGGWKCIPVDPALTGSASTSVGTPSGTLDWFGVRWNVPSTGASKGYPMKIDAIRYGREIDVTAGDATTPATWSDLAAYDATGTRQWGICQPNPAGAEIQGIINWGTASTACYFDDDSGETIIVLDTEWTASDFTKIVIDHASTTFNMAGVTVKALGTNNPGQFVFNNASTTADLDGCTFDSIGITTLRAGVDATNCLWKKSAIVTQNGATLDGCTFNEPSGIEALLCDDLDLVTNSTFISDGTGYAIEIDTPGDYDLADSVFTGYAATGTPGTSGNEVIYNNSGGVVNISTSNNTGAITYRNGSGASTNVSETVALTVTVKDEANQAVEGAQVYIQKSKSETTEKGHPTNPYYSHATNNTLGDTSFDLVATDTIEADNPTSGWLNVKNRTTSPATEQWYRYASQDGAQTFTLPTAVTGTDGGFGTSTSLYEVGISAKNIQEGDTVRNTTDGEWATVISIIGDYVITTPLSGGASWTNDSYSVHTLAFAYDGADTCTVPIMNTETNASGIATVSYNYDVAMDVDIRIRQSSTGTKYIPYKTTGSISGAFSTTAVLIEDSIIG